jgi:hypothetical protein
MTSLEEEKMWNKLNKRTEGRIKFKLVAVLRLQTKIKGNEETNHEKRDTNNNNESLRWPKRNTKQPKEQEPFIKQKKTNLISQLTIYPVDLKF